MKIAPYTLILIGVLLVLFGVAAQGDITPRIAFIVVGAAAIFGAGLLRVLERR